ncbi:MAG: Cof-type HAD-IIB family hydrolase [Planctomycetota bacterium]
MGRHRSPGGPPLSWPPQEATPRPPHGAPVISPEKFNLDEELGLNKKKSKRPALDAIKPKPGQRKPAPGEQSRTTDQRLRAHRVDLVAIDLDGTLLTSDKRLSVKAIEAVTEVRRRGIKVVLASARPPRTVREIYDHLKLNTHQINYNGALVQHPDHAQPLMHQPLSPDLAYAICTVARKTDNRCIIALEILDKWYTDKHDPTLETETSKKFKPDYVGPLLEPLKQPITKLLVMAPPDRMAIIRKVLVERYKSAATLVVAEDHLTQISHYEADKGRALVRLCEKYGVDPAHTMAIGDGPNDVGMIRTAGVGVAMGNAFDEVKAVADVVAPTNDRDGVAHTLWKYVA